jgi:predicted ABC-type ATPase
MRKRCYIIAGPNGAGKTTFATTFLPIEAECLHFVNADLIAAGLSPLKPELAALAAGKVLLRRLDDLVARGESFAFESTLSGQAYQRRITKWRALGYETCLYFLSLSTVQVAIDRVGYRVREGGHDIPLNDIRRRFTRGRENFETIYKPIVDHWILFDNTGGIPVILDESK